MTAERQSTEEALTLKGDLARRVQEALGQNVHLCYQCVKCASGCPLAGYFDWQPNQIMRAVQLGQEEIAFHAQTTWLCACCQTCTTRCPQGLDVAGIMEFLAREALAQGVESPVPEADIFNQAFLRQVRLWGRAYEPGLIVEYNVRTGRLTQNAALGVKMLRKGKIALAPKRGRPPRQAKPLPEAGDALAYYPGCSLHAMAAEFNISAQAVCQALGIKLIEPRGWVCCGSTAAHRADPDSAQRLPMQNLALIEQSGFDEVVMPCAACFNRHMTALRHRRQQEDQSEAGITSPASGYVYQDKVKVSSLLEAVHRHAVPGKLAGRSLQNLRLVCYYGCLLTRPPQVTEAEQPENPTEMDELLAAWGADVRDWSYKTACCGASHSLIRPEIVLDLGGDLIRQARQAGADAIVVACPLCHANLDARQAEMKLDAAMPILYFTQLMALALGLPEEAAALNKNLVDPRPLLKEKGVLKVRRET